MSLPSTSLDAWFNYQLELVLTDSPAPKDSPWRELVDAQKTNIATLQETVRVLKSIIDMQDTTIDMLKKQPGGPAC